MIPIVSTDTSKERDVPRIRGDDPPIPLFDEIDYECSPHTRG
mgnify:CR=1 FL=1